MTQKPTSSEEESWDISPRRNQKSRQKSPQAKTRPSNNNPTTPNVSPTAITLASNLPQPVSSPNSSSSSPRMAQPTRLLVCSLGNPAPYLNTLHSAGHIILSSLASAFSFPTFTKSRPYANGLLSTSPSPSESPYTFWQSPSLMNVSGPAVASAWRQFLRDTPSDCARKLVVVHDELELPLGQVKVKKGEASAKGHNGLKSCKEQLSGIEWWRIGVGIGRPVSRDPDVVAKYVLAKMSAGERERIVGATGKVEGELRKIAG